MARPEGTDGLLVGPQTTDEKTIEFLECEYAAQTLGVGFVPSTATRVVIENVPFNMYVEGSIASAVAPVDLNPAKPSVECAPLTRTMLKSVNRKVKIAGQFPLIGGDKCIITGGTQPRSLKSPFVSDRIYIQTQVAPPTEEE